MPGWIPQYAKAFVAGVIAGLASAEASLSNGRSFTARDIIAVILASLVAFGGVSITKNKPPS